MTPGPADALPNPPRDERGNTHDPRPARPRQHHPHHARACARVCGGRCQRRGPVQRDHRAAVPPYHTHRAGNGRLVDAFYLLPGHAQRAEGDYLDAAELSIWHHKDARCYRATLSATSIRLQGGMFGQRFSLFAARTTTQVLSIPAARFNAAKFAQFTTDVHAELAARRTAEGDQS